MAILSITKENPNVSPKLKLTKEIPSTPTKTVLTKFFPTKTVYPPTCTTNTGQTFTQDIGNELDKKNLAKVSSPRPGQKIASPLSISGSARGNWFFEGNLPIKLVDANGKTIASTTAESLGDWMTNDFVDFTATIKFKPPYGSGKLIIQKSNPSNLPENSDQLEIHSFEI